MTHKRIGAALVSTGLLFSMMLAGCSTSKDAASSTAGSSEANNEVEQDVVTALLPPVTTLGFQDRLAQYKKDFEAENPGVTVEFTTASWEDIKEKLNVQINAGSPPDVSFIGADAVNKYMESELLVDISKYAEPAMLEDFDADVLNYFRNGEGVYGFPTYAEIQAIGGNREMMEAAGIDWKKVQENGWTYDEFRKAIKAGTVEDRYGFVFASAGVVSKDFFSIFSKNAGMPSQFDDNLKYVYTSSKMLPFLKDLRSFIDDGSMPKELSSIDGGKRWNMFLTGQTMITGKGLSVFERMAAENNAKLEANDGTAVEGSVNAEYIVLPVPTFQGHPEQAQGIVDGFVCFRGKEEPTEQHLKNAAKLAYFLASGERAADTVRDIYGGPVAKSTVDALAAKPPLEGKNENNTKAVERLMKNIAPARPDITPELGALANKIEEEVIVPKFQGLLAGEISPEEMYEAIKKAGIDAFGEAGCILD